MEYSLTNVSLLKAHLEYLKAHLDYIQQCTRVANAISGLKKATTICGDKEINEEIRNGTINEHIHVSTSKKYTKMQLRPALYLMLCLHLSITSTTGYVALIPPQNYTVFENNASAVFYCIGDGSAVGWFLNGSGFNAVHTQREIRVVPATPTGNIVTSSLYIPSNSTNNNTEVICKVIDISFTNIQTSEPANLTVQGPLDAPYNFSVAMSNTSLVLSWGAPFSLNVTNNTKIFYYTLCTNITIYGCKTIPSDPDCTFPRNCTSSVDFTDPSLNGTNKTIMDYGDPILFKFFAINGAGNGKLSEYVYHIHVNYKNLRIQVSPSPTETVLVSTISYTNNSKSAVSIGLISGVAALVVLSLATCIIVAIICSFVKRKACNSLRLKPNSEHNDYCEQSIHGEDPGYFLPLSDFRTVKCTSQGAADKSCIESGIQHQHKVESGYADVVCAPIISIPAPKQEVAYSEVVAHNNEVVTPFSVAKYRKQSPPRIQVDGDDESIEEEIKDLEKDNIPKTYSYPSTKRSQQQRRIECDGDDGDVKETNKDLMKKDKLQISSSASHDSSQSQQCTEYDKDNEKDWCQNSTTEKVATAPQQFTSGVLVGTGCVDSKQKTNQRTISEVINNDENSSCGLVLPFTHVHLKTEYIEDQNFFTSKESNISDDASSFDEGRTAEQSFHWLMHWHNIIFRTVEHWNSSNGSVFTCRPHYLSPADMPVLSSIVPSVTGVKVQSFEKSFKETECDIHVQDTLNEQAEVALEVAGICDENGTNIATCLKTTKETLLEEITPLQHTLPLYTISKVYAATDPPVLEQHPNDHHSNFEVLKYSLSMDERSRAFFKWYVETKFGSAGVGKDDCFVFQDKKELMRNTNAIKGGLDDVHTTQPQPAPMSSRITVAVISELLISLLLLMSGDIEENPGPVGPEGPEREDYNGVLQSVYVVSIPAVILLRSFCTTTLINYALWQLQEVKEKLGSIAHRKEFVRQLHEVKKKARRSITATGAHKFRYVMQLQIGKKKARNLFASMTATGAHKTEDGALVSLFIECLDKLSNQTLMVSSPEVDASLVCESGFPEELEGFHDDDIIELKFLLDELIAAITNPFIYVHEESCRDIIIKLECSLIKLQVTITNSKILWKYLHKLYCLLNIMQEVMKSTGKKSKRYHNILHNDALVSYVLADVCDEVFGGFLAPASITPISKKLCLKEMVSSLYVYESIQMSENQKMNIIQILINIYASQNPFIETIWNIHCEVKNLLSEGESNHHMMGMASIREADVQKNVNCRQIDSGTI